MITEVRACRIRPGSASASSSSAVLRTILPSGSSDLRPPDSRGSWPSSSSSSPSSRMRVSWAATLQLLILHGHMRSMDWWPASHDPAWPHEGDLVQGGWSVWFVAGLHLMMLHGDRLCQGLRLGTAAQAAVSTAMGSVQLAASRSMRPGCLRTPATHDATGWLLTVGSQDHVAPLAPPGTHFLDADELGCARAKSGVNPRSNSRLLSGINGQNLHSPGMYGQHGHRAVRQVLPSSDVLGPCLGLQVP